LRHCLSSAILYFGRINGSSRRQLLGKFPRMSLDAARAAAMRLFDGGASHTPLTFSQLREQYLVSTEFLALSPRTQRSYRWVLRRKDYAHLASRKLRDISRQDVLAIRDSVAQSGRVFANVMRPVQALFSWSVDRGYLDASPAMRLKLPQNTADARPFTDAELGEMMHACYHKLEEPYRTYFLLIAYTGQRPVTWGSARWSELDLKRGVFTIARKRARTTKLGRGWSIPLAWQAVDLLKDLRKQQGRSASEFIFGRELTLEQKVRDRVAELAGMASSVSRGTPYRLRATFITWLNGQGVSQEEQQRLAGHASPMAGSRAHYIPPPPTKTMVESAQAYADHAHLRSML
jgi:integrase